VKQYKEEFDRGHTRLLTGERIRKDDPIPETVGTIDELSAFLGFAATFSKHEETTDLIRKIQRDLFRLNADLVAPTSHKVPRLLKQHVEEMEQLMQAHEERLPPLTKFVFASGSPAGAALHLARTICRRAERRLTTAHFARAVNPEILRYLNRLSDLLFSVARMENIREKEPEVVWEATE